MTIRQKILQWFYPLLMRLPGRKQVFARNNPPLPARSFHELRSLKSNDQDFSFSSLKGKKVLLVNTASDCGYTAQLEDLESLSKCYEDKLVVIGFPSNEFGAQEKGTDDEIETFCRLHYHVDFPLMKKSVVLKSDKQHPVYAWLTDPALNGWNSRVPVWNFCKYLVDEEGRLLAFFGPGISPLSKPILDFLI